MRLSIERLLGNLLPRPRSIITGNRTPYTGEQLREIRKRKGVGRRLDRLGLAQAFNRRDEKVYPALLASHCGRPSPNLAEWQRKQRRGESADDYRARRAA